MKVIINRSDAIGDTILTIPMVKLLKQKYPQATVLFIISQKCKDLFLENGDVDQVWILDHSRSLFKRLIALLKLFKEFRPDYYFFVGGKSLPSLVAWLMRVKFRGGLVSRLETFFLLNKGVRQKRSILEMHEADYNMNLLAPMGIHYQHDERKRYFPAMSVGREEQERALANLQQQLAKEEIEFRSEMIFVHPGMVGHTLNWPSVNYGRLIASMEKKWKDRFLFIISHTPSDKKFFGGIEEELNLEKNIHLKKKVFFLDGSKNGLRNYLALLSQATLFVGPSTGNTHMANSLGIKQIGIYSPIKVQSALRWGPFFIDETRVRILVPDVVCGEEIDCALEMCPYYECLSKIEVDDVLSEIEELLESER